MRLSNHAAVATLVVLTATIGYSDTVTTTDHMSVNGILVKLSAGTITLKAQFRSGPTTLLIPLSAVEIIEFNSVAFNPGPPPRAFGIGPGSSSSPAGVSQKPRTITDGIELRGSNGERQTCKVISIDESVVQCSGTSSASNNSGRPREYRRKIVARILVGDGQ